LVFAMKVLVLNAGSSSLKFQVINTRKKEVLVKGVVDAIGLDRSRIEYSIYDNSSKKYFVETRIKNHEEGVKFALDIIEESGIKLRDIKVVAHRVVHGGSRYKESTIINKRVLEEINRLSDLAPLHNPKNILGIKAAMKLLKRAKHVAVFDTSFHQTIPEEAFLYGLPIEFYEKYGIRKYGFHGTSHKFVANEAVKILGLKSFKLITCHLGNGISITAVRVRNKKPISLDTSMGLTPLEGPMMGTRSGTIDPGIIIYLWRNKIIKNPDELDQLLNKKSGLLGISELSSDMRDLLETRNKRQKSMLAIRMLTYQIAKIIASYTTTLNGVDALVFTAGMGENSWLIRKLICDKLKHFGIILDEKKNKNNDLIISSKKSRVKVLVIKTNEELQMALEAERVVRRKK